jgi:hypothetical protein
MKFAVISPIAYLDEFSTNYHLVLAQLYRSSVAYRSFYKKRQMKGDFVILDNGAAEQGHSIEASDLFYMALELHPNVLVCPDVLKDKDATLSATNHFLDSYADPLTKAGIKLMAVPQGKTAEEWYNAFIWFHSDPTIEWIGVSKYVAGAFSNRLGALTAIKSVMKKKCHLLGLADDSRIIVDEKRFKFVQSTDSAVPVKLGMQHLELNDYALKQSMEDEVYFTTSNLEGSAIKQIHSNIELYVQLCK